MDDREMDIYPIEHRGKVYNIITSCDMSFREVRGMLDLLAERNAFLADPENDVLGPGKLVVLEVEGVRLEVDVQGYEIIVYRRSPA